MLKTGFAAAAFAVLLAAPALAADADLPANIAAAAVDPARAEQASLDAKRHGPEILAFAGVKSGAKVVDLIPGGGYWTRLLAKAVGPTGHVYSVLPYEYISGPPEAAQEFAGSIALAGSPGYANVSAVRQSAAAFAAPEPVDLVFTSQNYHDYNLKFMGPVDYAAFDKAVFSALKAGGVFLVIDYVAAAGTGLADTRQHRIDPAEVKAELTRAGFQFVGESRLLANSTDDHTKRLFDPAIRGHLDQFIYKFRKPG